MNRGYAGPRGDGVEPHVRAYPQCAVSLLEFEPMPVRATRHSTAENFGLETTDVPHTDKDSGAKQ